MSEGERDVGRKREREGGWREKEREKGKMEGEIEEGERGRERN